jgi:hypothetical protein
MAKIEFYKYQTKTNRKELTGAFANKDVVYWNTILNDIDMVAVSSINKAIVFNTSRINPSGSKKTVGIQVQKQKDDSVTEMFASLNDSQNEELEYYRTANAGIGKYVRKEDEELIKSLKNPVQAQ